MHDSPLKPRRSSPLTPDEEAAILHAVTVGRRTQRSVGADPSIKGSHDQVRRVVDKAVRADPSLLEQYPHLKRPADALRVLEVAASDDAELRATVADALAAAGITNADVRIVSGFTRVREQYRVTRDSDGCAAVVRVPDFYTQCKWELDDGATIRVPMMEVPAEFSEVMHRRAGGPRRRWLTVAGVVFALLVSAAVCVWLYVPASTAHDALATQRPPASR